MYSKLLGRYNFVAKKEAYMNRDTSFKNFFEQSNTGFLLFELSLSGTIGKENLKIIFINESYKRVSGYLSEKELKSFILDVLLKEKISPDLFFEKLSKEYNLNFKYKGEKTGNHYRVSIKPIDVNSNKAIILVSVKPYHDYLKSLYSFDRDEKFDMNFFLRERKIFESLFESSLINITIIDAEGKISYSNQKSFKLENDNYNYIGRYLKDYLKNYSFYTPEGFEKSLNDIPIIRSLNKKEIIENELQRVVYNDEIMWHVASSKPIYIEDELFGAIELFVDLTKEMNLIENLQKKKDEFENFFSVNIDLFCIINNSSIIIRLNDEWKNLLGYDLSELRNRNIFGFIHPEDIAKTESIFNSFKFDNDVPNFINRIRCKNNNYKYIEWKVKKIDNYLYCSLRDVSERIKNEKYKKEELERSNRLVKVLNFQSDSFQEILNYTLEEVIELTSSEIGYIFFYDEKKKIFTHNTWSKKVMDSCSIFPIPHFYQLNETGFWGEPVRQRKSIINNDFESPHRLKKGYPQGHVKLRKFMTIPVFSDNKIVAVVGVGNKKEDYTNRDLISLELFMNSAWKRVERLLALKKIKDNEENYRKLFNNLAVGCTLYDVKYDIHSDPVDLRIKDVNRAFEDILDLKREDVIGKLDSEVFDKVPVKFLDIYKRILNTDLREEYEVYANQFNKYMSEIIYSPSPGKLIALFTDITKRKIAEINLKSQEERSRVTLESIGDAVIATDINSTIVTFNKIAKELTGWNEDEAVGKELTEVFDIRNSDTDEKIKNPVDDVIKNKKRKVISNNTYLISKNGQKKIIKDSVSPILDDQLNVIGAVLIFSDITQEKENREKILYLSVHDSLTGLYNRSYFEEILKNIDLKSEFPVSFIHVDIDGLKITNDVLGYQQGDFLLKEVGRIIKQNTKQKDVIARWGGDAFIVYLPSTDKKNIDRICERLKKQCSTIDNKFVKPSISIGYSTQENYDDRLEELLRIAEDSLFRSKLLTDKSYRSSVISTLKQTLFEKDYETEEHANRLKKYALKIAQRLNFSSLEKGELELAAVLHDIGKVGISDTILLKPGKLDEREWEIIKTHPEKGYRIALSTKELAPVADYILCHHERWDGKGYPNGLKEEKIPLLSRIISVVDSYDVMTHRRPYKKAMNKNDAIDELKKCSGNQFDPEIIEIFLDILSKNNS